MKRKLNRRFFLVIVLAVCMTLALTAGICYEMFRTQVMEDLAACAHLLASEGTVLPREEDVLGQDGLRVTLIGPDGSVLYDTDAEAAQMESHLHRPEVQQAMQEGEGSAVRRSSTLGQNTFYYAVRTEDGNVLRAAKDAHGILLVFAKALPAALLASAVLIALGMVLSSRLSRSFVAPIERLAHDMDGAGGQQTAASYPELVPLMDTIRSQHEAIVKNADMRQEFTANVSHELKTPLTSIINFVKLLKRENIEDERIRGYIEVLDAKSQRLRQLTDDLVEASKISSGNISLHMERINFVELINQTIGEFTEKMEEKCLQVIPMMPERSVYIEADSRRIWRVVENLFGNVYKYALEGTRVYLDLVERVENGQKVKKGEPLMKIDISYLKEHAPSLCSPVLCTELGDNQKVRLLKEGEIKAGEPLFAVDVYEA